MVNREKYTPQSESKIEGKVCEYATSEGLTQYKFASPNNRGVPDRIFLYRGRAMFIEFKAEGVATWSPLQIKHRDTLAEQGCPVFLVNNVDQGEGVIDGFIGAVDKACNFWGD